MKRSYSIILLLVCYLFFMGYAKGENIINTPSKDSILRSRMPDFAREIRLKTSYVLDSRGIGNKSIFDYFTGKYFTKDDINLLNRNLKSTSVLGQDFIIDVGYDRGRPFLNNIHYGYRSHSDISIGKDLAGLASRGNAPYAGKNLDNTNLLLRSSSWHKIGISFRWILDRRYEEASYITTSINYVSGNSYNYINLSNTQIYTQQNGDYIDAKWNIDYRSSVTHNVFGFNGNGASIDMKYSQYFKIRKNKIPVLVEASITDLGFISWNRNNKNLSWDSSLRFTGFDVSNITAITSKSYTDHLSDSLKTILNSHYNYLRNNAVLPAILVLKISKKYTNGNSSNIIYTKLDYMIQASYKPQFTVGVESYKKRHGWIPQIRFGGYGDFNIDLSYIYKSKGSWQFSTKLYSLEALIAPKYQSGLGLFFQTNYKF